MEGRNHRRKSSCETRFELNAILSNFKYSRAIFLNKKQQHQVLDGRSPKQASFPYNQDPSFEDFDSGTASEVPPVHELFAGFIGPYQYSIPHNAQASCAVISGIEHRPSSRTPSRDQDLSSIDLDLTQERQPLLHENSINSKDGNSESGSKEYKWLPEIIDLDDAWEKPAKTFYLKVNPNFVMLLLYLVNFAKF